MSPPRLGREEQFPAGPGPRGRELRRAEKPGESAPGSGRGSAGGTGRGGRRRVPAHPAAPAPPKAGAPRPLPQSETGERRSAHRGARLPSGDPRAHHRALCVAKFKLSLRECPAAAASAAFPGDSEKQGVVGLAGRRRGGGAGLCPGRAGLQGKFSWWRPGREQPRCSWPGPGRLQKAPELSEGPVP